MSNESESIRHENTVALEGYVQVAPVNHLSPGDAPIEVTETIQVQHPNAIARMLTRIDDLPSGEPQFFSVGSICTHQSCPILTGSFAWGTTDQPIYDPDSKIVTCPCHGSRFDVRDGSIVQGPALQSLPRFPTKVFDETVFVAVHPEI